MASLTLATGCSRGIDDEQAARIAQRLYATESSGALEVMQVRPVSGLLHVTLKKADGKYLDVYLTQDGRRFTTRLDDVAAEEQARRDDARFASCLREAGVSVLVGQNPASAAQLHDLGRSAATLAIPCADDLQNCRALGVTELPTLKKGEQLHPGRHTLGWVETLTGCKR